MALADPDLVEAVNSIAKAILQGPREYTITGASDWKQITGAIASGLLLLFWFGKYFISSITAAMEKQERSIWAAIESFKRDIKDQLQTERSQCQECKRELREEIWNGKERRKGG